MKPSLHVVTSDNLAHVLPLMQAYYRFDHHHFDVARARAAWDEFLAYEYLGRGWLVYVVLTFGFSLEFGGRDAFIDELFLDEAVRGQGVGRQVLERVFAAATAHNIRAIHLEVDRDNTPAQAFYEAIGFERRGRYFIMSKPLLGG